MEQLQAKRLTKKSQALALDEFQMIDLNLHLIKNAEENDSPPDTKNNSKALVGSGSSTRLKRRGSSKLNRSSFDSRRSSKSRDRLGFSSAEELINLGRTRSSEDFSDTRRKSGDVKAVRSFEETIMKVIELSKLEEFAKFEDEKPAHLVEPKAHGSWASLDHRDICRKKTCLDSKVRLPPIKRTESQNIAWDIKGLGVQQVVEQKLPISIQRVDMRRKERHDYIVKEIDLRMNDLNEVIEQEIRKEAENIVSNIQMIKENVEQILLTIKEKPSVNMNDRLIMRMQGIIKQLNDSRLKKIDSFCDFVRKLERHRSERFKLILKNAYKEMHENMYLMPYDIQKFFEKKIQHLNEITMNNYHCYTELEKKLKLQMEEEMRLWFQVLKCHEAIKKAIVEDRESVQEPIRTVSEEITKGPTRQDILKKLQKAEEDFSRLKRVAKNLKYLESHPAIEVFENYFDEIRNAANALFNAGLIGTEGLRLDERAIQDLSTMHCIDEEELQKMWSDATQEIMNTLESNLKSFSYSTRIFDSYFDRLEELRALYRQQVFLLVTKNDKQTVQMNNVMNVLIDTLRQDVSEDNLNKTMQQIQSTLTNIDILIQSHLKDETALVDKFVQLSLSNVDILLEELERFVTQFVPPPDSDPRKMKKRASWMDVAELQTKDHLFSREFLNCRFLMQGIDNWQFGVWHALIMTRDTSKQIIAVLLDNWANAEKQKLKKRSELKVTINNVRIHNIREDFWKVRLVELNIHEERFKQHELAVLEKIDYLSLLKRGMKEFFDNFLQTEYNGALNEIMTEYTSIKKERHAVGLLNKLKALYSLVSLEMKKRHDYFKHEYFTTLSDIRNSHIKFMKSIRLFSEDGNFTADEAKALMKKITAMEKIMSKEFSRNKENIENIYEDFIDACHGKLEIPLSNLNKSMEEFTFRDEVERKIKRLHRVIGEAVFDLSYDIKKLNDKIKSWYSTSYKKENLGSYDFLFSFSRCFKEILSDIHDMRQKLHYDDSLAPSEKLLKQKLEISQISLTAGVVAKGKKNQVEEGAKKLERRRSVRMTSPLIKTKNYVFLLYPSPPQDDRSFFSTMHHKTYTSYCDIQESAKVFYETHGEILDSSRIPSDYKAFVEEIVMKYKYYQLQLEFAWLDSAIEFYDILSYFHRFLGNYYFDTLKKYFESRNERLMEKCSELSKILEVNLKAVEDNYVSIHNKLKPMFGHPEKVRMLAIVETFIDQAIDFNNRILLDPLEPSKESIKQHCITTETIFLDMERILSCIKCSTTLLILFKELEDKMLERIDILQRILSPDNSSLDVANQTDFDVDLRQRLQDYKSKASMPTDCVITYTSITQSITPIESVAPLDFEKIIRNNFNEYEKMADKIEMVKTKCSSIHEKYRTMWEQDIQRILNLYRVKYDAVIPD